jgi:hypothetical protein
MRKRQRERERNRERENMLRLARSLGHIESSRARGLFKPHPTPEGSSYEVPMPVTQAAAHSKSILAMRRVFPLTCSHSIGCRTKVRIADPRTSSHT